VSEEQSPAQQSGSTEAERHRRPPLLVLLVVILLLEFVLMVSAVVFLAIELVVARPDSYPTAIAILVLAVIAAVWLAATARGTLRGRQWTRGATVVWQLLQIAVAVGSFQGLFARADVGWLLLVPAIAALVLLFTPSVIAATTHSSR